MTDSPVMPNDGSVSRSAVIRDEGRISSGVTFHCGTSAVSDSRVC